MYKGLNEMNMEELICTDGGGVGWLAVAGAVVTQVPWFRGDMKYMKAGRLYQIVKNKRD